MTTSRSRRTKPAPRRPDPAPALDPVFGLDADAALIEPAEVRIGRRIYRAPNLSIVEWAPFLERYQALLDLEGEEFQRLKLLSPKTLVVGYQLCVDYLNVVLPREAVQQLEARGTRLVKKVFTHFFCHQCYVHGVALRTPTDAARDLSTSERLPSGAGTSSASGTTGGAGSG